MRRAVLLLLAVLSVLACRKAPTPAPQAALPPPPPLPEVQQASRPARPVIFVGLDGADWELLDGYMASGVMPNLAALARSGRTGTLKTLNPPLSPLVWTTMMTGASPLDHGILDFTRRDPKTGALEPISSSDRRWPAIWNMATVGDKSVAVFGLWATWPAEPVKGLLVADRFSFRDSEPLPATVYPPSQEAWARQTLSQTRSAVGFDALHAYHALATAWLAREKPDLTVVYLQGTDTPRHVFASPRQPAVSAENFARDSRVPALYFTEIDRMLGDYRKLAETRGAVLMIASAGRSHRDEGIYLLWGPDIQPAADRGHGEVGQVCATLLALLGLPPGDGVDGPPLAEIDPVHARLADYRGHYRPAPEIEGSGGGPAGSTRTAGSYNNEGLLRRERGETDGAVAAYEKALEVDPQNAAAMWNLSDLLHSQHQDLDRSDDLLVKALAAGLPEAVDYTLGRTVAYARTGESDRGLRLLERALATRPQDPRLHLLRGRYRLERRQCEKALDDFEAAASADPHNALAFASVGLAQLCVGDGEAAAQSFQRSLQLDPNQPEIRRALGQIGR